MTEIEEWIEEAIDEIDPSGSRVKKASSEMSRDVLKRAKDKFVEGEPRSWWQSLKLKPQAYDSSTVSLQRVFPTPDEKCWFIPETGEIDLPVYEIETAVVSKLLDECPLFEYYLVGRNIDWLVAESDHDEFLVVS